MNTDIDQDLNKRLQRIELRLESISGGAGAPPYGSATSTENAAEIDFREIWNIAWRGKWWVIAITFLFVVTSVAYALSLPNKYKSEVLLAPAEGGANVGLGSVAGQLGGLASLAGVNLGGGGSDKQALAIEVLKSRKFISSFIQRNNLLVPLMAAKEWDANSNTLIFDSDIYNPEEKKWVRDVKPPRTAEPSLQEAYKEFMNIMTVSKDKSTNFVSIGVKFYSPQLAKLWVDLLVEDLNNEVRIRDVEEAKKSIEYLTEQLDKTSVAHMKAIFYELIEDQMKTVMFAEVREEYVFNTIDPAAIPELKVEPKRTLIVLIGAILGGLISMFIVLFREFIKYQ